ncbi:hypothetical protein EV715DRAFT_294291 [Schizophyllum commune]
MITSADSIQDIYPSGDGSTVHESPMTFRIVRPLTTEDWLPVVGRARCLKNLRLTGISNACTNETLEAIIACPPPRVPLFPGVRTAQFDRPYRAGQESFVYHRLLSILLPPHDISKLRCAVYEADIPDAHAFLSHFPSLESLEMILGAGEYAHRHSQFINTWPYFVFDPSHDPAKRYDIQFIGALRICPRLRDIDIKFDPRITAHIVEALAQLPALQTLRLRFGNHANPSESQRPWSTIMCCPGHSLSEQDQVLAILPLCGQRRHICHMDYHEQTIEEAHDQQSAGSQPSCLGLGSTQVVLAQTAQRIALEYS